MSDPQTLATDLFADLFGVLREQGIAAFTAVYKGEWGDVFFDRWEAVDAEGNALLDMNDEESIGADARTMLVDAAHSFLEDNEILETLKADFGGEARLTLDPGDATVRTYVELIDEVAETPGDKTERSVALDADGAQQEGPSLDDKEAQTLAAAFDVLDEMGVKDVTLAFYGGGDSGQVDEVCPTMPEGRAFDSNRTVRHVDTSKRVVDMPIHEFLEEAVMPVVHLTNVDWWNNDGGAGNAFVDVARRTVDVEAYRYLRETLPWKDETLSIAVPGAVSEPTP